MAVAFGDHFNMWFWDDPTFVKLDKHGWNRTNAVLAASTASSLNESITDEAVGTPLEERREGQTSH